MGRVSLTETALQIKKLDLGSVEHVLSRAPDPPTPEAVRDAITTLTEAGALDDAGALTPLGHHLARLPVDVRAGKIIVLGAVLGCLKPALTIAAYLSSKSPFVAPQDERDAADRVRVAFAAPKAPGIAAGQFSDHLVVVTAYDGWQAAVASGGSRAGADFCRRHYLCPLTLAALHGTWPGASYASTHRRALTCMRMRRLWQTCAASLPSFLRTQASSAARVRWRLALLSPGACLTSCVPQWCADRRLTRLMTRRLRGMRTPLMRRCAVRKRCRNRLLTLGRAGHTGRRSVRWPVPAGCRGHRGGWTSRVDGW